MKRLSIGAIALGLYVLCVFAANWFIQHVGHQAAPGAPHTLPVWPGWEAPSGFVWVGVALTARDVVQRQLGRSWAIAAILVGAGLSYFVAPALAFASGLAFLVSELLDFAVYTPLADRNLTWAVVASNWVGAIVDSVLFLWVGFNWQAVHDFWFNQAFGKLWVSLLFLPAIWISRRPGCTCGDYRHVFGSHAPDCDRARQSALLPRHA